MYAVTVTFQAKPDQWEAFLPLMLENARASRETEPGCRQFDVLTDPARPHTVSLYELYDDRTAFDTHLASPHFTAFKAATADMLEVSEIVTWAGLHR